MSTDACCTCSCIMPAWLIASYADYLYHRAIGIERTSGVGESLLHLLQFADVGLPLLSALFLEVNTTVLLFSSGGADSAPCYRPGTSAMPTRHAAYYPSNSTSMVSVR